MRVAVTRVAVTRVAMKTRVAVSMLEQGVAIAHT
jgi:hypothetical protein